MNRIDELAKKYSGDCTCHVSYTSRKRNDPQCRFHNEFNEFRACLTEFAAGEPTNAAPQSPCRTPMSSSRLAETPDSTNSVSPVRATTLNESTPDIQTAGAAPTPETDSALERFPIEGAFAIFPIMKKLERERDAARRENEQWTKWGTIEVAIRNPSVMESMKHWEGRAEKAEAALAERDAEIARLLKGLDAVSALINESSGVAGLHRNGDIAYWQELQTGGFFEDWLIDFDAARKK